MRATKKLTLSAIITAFGALFMSLGAFVEVFDLTAAALASLLMVFVYLEIGSPYTYLVWICTTLISALIYPGSLLWLEYLFIFGIYPILKGYIERLYRPFWLILKLLYANLTVFLVFYLGELVLGIPFSEGELFGLPGYAVRLVLVLLLNLAFLLYDIFINVMVRFYMTRLRGRFKRFLK